MFNSTDPLKDVFRRFATQRGLIFGALIIGALMAFEIFNYSTTEFAMTDLIGDLQFAGVRWATILALAFCGIDFAGIARLFTPQHGADEPAEVWYLFGAWLLAATMNALLTWWGVSIAVLNTDTLGSAVIAREVLLKWVPVFVALMVWLSRVLIIGTFSIAGERLFSQDEQRVPLRRPARQPANAYRRAPAPRPAMGNAYAPSFRPAPKQTHRPEPTYQQMPMIAGAPEDPQPRRYE